MKRDRRKITAFLAFLTVIIVVASFAYWNQKVSVANPFDTGKYGSTIVEHFNPNEGKNWQPGVNVRKEVSVQNTGNQDILVRIKLDESWTKNGEKLPYKVNSATTDAGKKGDVYSVGQTSADDGETALDQSVVEKQFSDSTEWIDGKDGWFYYRTNLPGGSITDAWLKAVTLLPQADMGKKHVRWYVTADASVTDATTWTEYDGAVEPMPSQIDNQPVRHSKVEDSYQLDGNGKDLSGYSHSSYTLTVTTQTIQATQEAVDYVFGGGNSFHHPSGCIWTMKD